MSKKVGRPAKVDAVPIPETKINMRITGDHHGKLMAIRSMLGPIDPEVVPITEVIKYCLEFTHKSMFDPRKDGSR